MLRSDYTKSIFRILNCSNEYISTIAIHSFMSSIFHVKQVQDSFVWNIDLILLIITNFGSLLRSRPIRIMDSQVSDFYLSLIVINMKFNKMKEGNLLVIQLTIYKANYTIREYCKTQGYLQKYPIWRKTFT